MLTSIRTSSVKIELKFATLGRFEHFLTIKFLIRMTFLTVNICISHNGDLLREFFNSLHLFIIALGNLEMLSYPTRMKSARSRSPCLRTAS